MATTYLLRIWQKGRVVMSNLSTIGCEHGTRLSLWGFGKVLIIQVLNLSNSRGLKVNLALFGLTARDWKSLNPDAKGNMRDYASPEQLVVLVNLENLNAEFIKQGLKADDRLKRLNEIAIQQISVLVNVTNKLLKTP